MNALPFLPPCNPVQKSVITPHRTFIKREKRELRAFTIHFIDERMGVCVWLPDEPSRDRFQLSATIDSWLDVRKGDKILVWDAGKQAWIQRTVSRITLHRVFPVKYCDEVVTTAREWLNGVNGVHKSEYGQLGDRLPSDLRGFVPTAKTGPFDLEFDHIEDTHTIGGALTGYGRWWQDYRWPQITTEVKRLVQEVKASTEPVVNGPKRRPTRAS